MKKVYFLCTITFLFLSYLFICKYISFENIYDNFRFYSYHQEYINAIETIKSEKFLSLIEFFYKIKCSICSYTSVILLAFIGQFFNYSRLNYILFLDYIYLLPAIILTFFAYKTFLVKKKENSIYIDTLLLIILSLNVYYWLPVLRGMPDVAALIPFIFSIFVILKNDFVNKINFKYSILTGFLIFLTFLFRRTFSTAVLILLITTFMVNTFFIFYNALKEKYPRKKVILQFVCLLFNLLIPSVIFILLFKFCLPTLYEYFIYGGLIEECNYYLSNSNIIEKSINIISYINPVSLIFILVPLFFVKKNDKEINRFLLFAYIYVFLYVILFLFIQDIIFENVLPIAFFINILTLYGLYLFFSKLKIKQVKVLINILLFLFYFTNFYLFFFKETYKFDNIGQYVFSKANESGTPLQNVNYDKFIKMYVFLKNEINRKPNCRISSVTYERLFDPETIIYYSKVRNDGVAENIINIPAVTTQGLIFEAYESDYMIVAENWGSISEEAWLPVSIPHNDFKNGTGLSLFYKKIWETDTNTDESKKIYIYKKTKDIPLSEMENFAERFIQKAPDKEDLILKQLEEYKDNKIVNVVE